MTRIPITTLTDIDLLAETARVAASERRTTAELLELLAEIETRKLYLGESCSSLFKYCRQVLRLSEPAAYSRITAARAARRFPIIIPLLTDGEVTLTTITLLAAHLTDENHEAVLHAARHKSKLEIQRLVATLDPQPDVPSSIRKVPVPAVTQAERQSDKEAEGQSGRDLSGTPHIPSAPVAPPPSTDRRSIVAPLAPERYLVKITIDRQTHDKLQRARDLLRHSIPNGDPAAIVERALTVLIAQLEKTKLAAATRPRAQKTASLRRTRHIPAAIKRDVFARDRGQCAFVGANGRCTETGFLQVHHLVPFAADGPTTVENLELRCRAHNLFEAEQFFGRSAPVRGRGSRSTERDLTLSGQS